MRNENRRLIGAKWDSKVKNDGTHRARCFALGYCQIPGVEYTEIQKKWYRLTLDVETAILEGNHELEEELFMKLKLLTG